MLELFEAHVCLFEFKNSCIGMFDMKSSIRWLFCIVLNSDGTTSSQNLSYYETAFLWFSIQVLAFIVIWDFLLIFLQGFGQLFELYFHCIFKIFGHRDAFTGTRGQTDNPNCNFQSPLSLISIFDWKFIVNRKENVDIFFTFMKDSVYANCSVDNSIANYVGSYISRFRRSAF